MSADLYHEWFYHPSRSKAPQWVHDFVEEVAAAHYAATDEPIGTAVAQTSSRRRAPR